MLLLRSFPVDQKNEGSEEEEEERGSNSFYHCVSIINQKNEAQGLGARIQFIFFLILCIIDHRHEEGGSMSPSHFLSH